jgi:hypothetical protein
MNPQSPKYKRLSKTTATSITNTSFKAPSLPFLTQIIAKMRITLISFISLAVAVSALPTTNVNIGVATARSPHGEGADEYGAKWAKRAEAGADEYGAKWAKRAEAGADEYGAKWAKRAEAGADEYGAKWAKRAEAGADEYGAKWAKRAEAGADEYGAKWA